MTYKTSDEKSHTGYKNDNTNDDNTYTIHGWWIQVPIGFLVLQTEWNSIFFHHYSCGRINSGSLTDQEIGIDQSSFVLRPGLAGRLSIIDHQVMT